MEMGCTKVRGERKIHRHLREMLLEIGMKSWPDSSRGLPIYHGQSKGFLMSAGDQQ